jgi:Fur family peroxide stress response transcriptional regulator
MPPTTNEPLDSFLEACRKLNLRLTPQRLEIFKMLAASSDHPTAEILHQRLIRRMPTLSLDTVYRTLGTFAQLGLINKVDTVESQARFEALHGQHHHVICRKCKEIMDFEWRQIDEVVLPENVHDWGAIDRKNVIVYGICRKCLE